MAQIEAEIDLVGLYRARKGGEYFIESVPFLLRILLLYFLV